MDPFDLIGKRIKDLSAIYDDDGPSATVQGSRPMFNNGGMLVQPSNDGSRPGYAKDKKNLYPREKGTDKYKLSEAYKKSITPKGYVDVQELIDLIDNPKLTQSLFTQARKFEKNPSKYPGRKNYVYNKIISLLGEKKVSRGGDSPYAQKIFYKKPNKKQIDTLTNFIDSRILETGTVKNLEILHKEFGKLFEGKQTKGFFTKTLTLDKARNVFLKKYGIKPTDSQLARAMMRLGQVYDGQLFQNDINISKNKRAGNFIDKSFNEIDMFSGWKGASYDAALDDISKNMPKKAGDIGSFKTTINKYIKQNYPDVFKNFDVNEIFSVTTSSVRGSYPYSYFVDLTKSDVNQKLLANFQGQASKAEGQIKKAIANYRRTGNVKFYEEALSVANKFNTVNRKKFLSDERVIKEGGANAVKLEIGSQQQIKDKIGFANEYYKQNNLDKWKSQGIDIDAHTGKSGYVKTLGTKTLPKGVSTFTDLVQDGEVNEKQFKRLIASLSNNPVCEVFSNKKANGGRIALKVGTPDINDCFNDGLLNIKEGRYKTVDQAQDAAKLLGGGKNVLRGLMKYGIVPEAAYVAGEAVFRTTLGEKPLDAIKKSIDSFTFGLTDFTSGIEAKKFGQDANQKLAVDKFRANQNKVNSIEQEIANLEALNTGSEFGYEGDQTKAIQIKKAQLEAAKKELEQNYVSPDIVQYIDRKAENIADAYKAKSDFAKASLKDQMDGIPGIGDYMDTETARIFPKQKTQMELNLNMLPNFRDAMQSEDVKKQKIIMNLPDEFLNSSVGPDAVQYKKDLQDAFKLENLKDKFGAEQIYGTQGTFAGQPLAGGGIAKMAGDRSGAMTRSMNPDSQGLSYLMNRVKKVQE
jgi:hypothetical protein